ncbi:hypothetical protein SKAU_G00172800 [Synaphobranchus kaupii]|uniref:Uncharacterized protein n=1 Tax=Synaphobranchus kaupii TaxID=118154 RepID=A0A9Q1FLB8_SYNKA|nr:hypothetical protein SKAU_G00172800 [Synaphobranchus kaupii]
MQTSIVLPSCSELQLFYFSIRVLSRKTIFHWSCQTDARAPRQTGQASVRAVPFHTVPTLTSFDTDTCLPRAI